MLSSPIPQEDDSPTELSSFCWPGRPFPNKRPWLAGRSVELQRPGTLLQAEQPGFGPAPSPLRRLWPSLRHERPQPGDDPPVRSSPIHHQPQLKRSTRFVPLQSLPVTVLILHFLVEKLEKGLIVA